MMDTKRDRRRRRLALLLVGATLTLLVPAAAFPSAQKASKEQPLLARLAGTSVAAGREFRGLLLYPIRADGPAPGSPALPQTSEEAHEKDNLSVAQSQPLGAGVNLVLYNWSLRPILVVAGEVFTGGSRERWVDGDVLVPSGHKVTVRAYPAALEPTPKKQRKPTLAPMGALVPPTFRLAALKHASIGAHLAELAGALSDAGVKKGEGTMGQLYAAKKIAARVRQYVATFDLEFGAKSDRTVGVTAFVGGRLVGADVFPDHAAFSSEWRPILESLSLQAALYELRTGHLQDASFRLGKDADRLRGAARIFVQQAFGAHFSKVQKHPGAGVLETVTDSQLVGRVLSFRGRLVHALLMPRVIALPTRMTATAKQKPPPPASPDEYSRGELERKAARGTLTQEEKRILNRMRQRDSSPTRGTPPRSAPPRSTPPAGGQPGSSTGPGAGQGYLPPH